MTKFSRQKKIYERNGNLCDIDDFCHAHGIEMDFINNEYQVRLSELVDVYPTSKKYFHLRNKKWGQYNDIHELLTYFS